MGRRKSAGLPTHLNLQGTGYGYGPSSSHNAPMVDSNLTNSSFGLRDVVSVVLISLPSCLASQLLQTAVSTTSGDSSLRLKNAPAQVSSTDWRVTYSLSITLVSSLTALILAVMGIGAKLVHLQKTPVRSSWQPTIASLQQMKYYELGQVALLRCLVIGLPLFSISCIGGVRVVVITLSAIAAGIPGARETDSSLRTWKRLLQPRQWLLTVIALQVIADLAGLSSSASSLKALLGYSALLMCIFLLPTVYSTTASRTSKLNLDAILEQSTRTEDSGSTSGQVDHVLEESPLISSPENIDLTLVIAGLLGLITFSFSLVTSSSAGAFFVGNLFWVVLVAFSFALSFTFSDLRSLKKARGVGSLVGSLISLILSIFATSNIDQTHTLCMAVFVVSCFAGSAMDDHRSAASQSTLSAHTGKHNHFSDPSILKISGASKITNLILSRVQNWPLLHTIIKEKDSRRIFYFMW